MATAKTEKTKLYKKPALWATIGVALLMLGTTLVSSLSEWREQKAVLAPTVPKPVAQEKEVVAVGWVDQGVVEEGKHFRLWVAFENRSGSPALGLRYRSFQIPGFHPGYLEVGGRLLSCWEEGPTCRPQGPGLPPALGLPARLERGQSVSVFAVLVPSTHRQFGASGVFIWLDDQGKEHEGAVVVPPVPAVAPGEPLLSSLGKVVLLLKDLLLPAALAYLGWYLKRRDEQEKQLQEAAKQKKEEEAERQARLRETWNLMLPKSHANTEKYYMPVVAAIDSLLTEARALQPEPSTDQQWRQLLWALLRFLRRMQQLAQDIGGFYFSKREGEALARACWSPFFRASRDRLGAVDRDRVLAVLDPWENLASFLDKMDEKLAEPLPEGWLRAVHESTRRESAQALARTETALRDWVAEGGFERNLPYLELLRTVLAYEMNRTYELWWYGEKMELNREDFWIALDRLPEGDPLRQVALGYLEKEELKTAAPRA